jgi:hypothetical protein
MECVQRARVQALPRFCDAIALELLNVERPLCEECNGSGQCETCSGMGVIEEENIKIAA